MPRHPDKKQKKKRPSRKAMVGKAAGILRGELGREPTREELSRKVAKIMREEKKKG